MGHSGIRKIKGDKETMQNRERRASQPVFVSIGIAIAFSFAGFVLSQIGTRTRPNSTVPSLVIEEEEEEEENSRHQTQNECNFMNETTHPQTKEGSTTTYTATSATDSPSPTRSSSGDEEGFLLPEFNNLVLEEFGSSMPDPYRNPDVNMTRIQSTCEIENEVFFLRNMVRSLEERETSLLSQLLEFSTLKEQDNSISQLKNQLEVKNVQTKLNTLKMGSLLSENHSLRAQLSENSRNMAELEETREQVRVLTNGLQLLREKMDQMHNGQNERSRRIGELEEELIDLRLVNARLEEEILELEWQLELQKVELWFDTTFHTSNEREAIEEAEKLRHEVEKLRNEIEQLKNSRCLDLEEMVYLKWINACLRYELRDHQPAHGKTLARDLSITLSPSSKEKAKQLIHDYACNSGPTSLDDSNWEYSSESSGDSSKISNSNKPKLFGKLKYFVLGKDEKRIDRAGDSCRFSSWGSASSCSAEELALPVHLQRPLDGQEKLVRSRSDAGLGYRGKCIVPMEGGFTGNGFHGNGYDGSEVPEKMHLKRLAAALEDPRGNINIPAASFSFTSFNSFATE